MFVQGLSFLVCQLLPIGYVMAAWLKNKTVGEFGEAISLATGEASAHNLDVQLVKSDGEKGVAAYAPELKKTGEASSLRSTTDSSASSVASLMCQVPWRIFLHMLTVASGATR